jgi:hypothetical protein
MSDLSAVYEQLARPWSHERLGDYRQAKDRAERMPEFDQERQIRGPVAMLASAVPACATLSVAIHVLHVLPATRDPGLIQQLLGNVEEHSSVVLHLCHRALELDGRAHDYTADEWLPAIEDNTAALLKAARLAREPPALVELAQEAVSWLSCAIVDLDQDARDAAAAIADGLGRALALYVFADLAGLATASPSE